MRLLVREHLIQRFCLLDLLCEFSRSLGLLCLSLGFRLGLHSLKFTVDSPVGLALDVPWNILIGLGFFYRKVHSFPVAIVPTQFLLRCVVFTQFSHLLGNFEDRFN